LAVLGVEEGTAWWSRQKKALCYGAATISCYVYVGRETIDNWNSERTI